MFIFPANLFNPKQVQARVVQNVMSGGQALNGDEDVIATDGGGRWHVDYSGIDLRTPKQLRAWSAWAGHLQGGATECLVPILSLASGPRPQAWDRSVRVGKLVTNDDVFPTTAAYSMPHISATIGANAALRATSLQVALTSQGSLEGGEKFSVGSYAYKLVRQTAPGVFQIEPPLREALTAATPVNFDWPVVKCRLVPGQDLEAAINLGRFSQVTISFIESPPAGGA